MKKKKLTIEKSFRMRKSNEREMKNIILYSDSEAGVREGQNFESAIMLCKIILKTTWVGAEKFHFLLACELNFVVVMGIFQFSRQAVLLFIEIKIKINKFSFKLNFKIPL